MHDRRYIWWGVLSGFLGSLVAALILWGSWLLPALGLIMTRVNLITGLVSVIILGILGGVVYALVLGTRTFPLRTSLILGLALGIILWSVGFLLLVPFLLGQGPFPLNPLENWTSFLAFILYGFMVALLYNRWLVQRSPRALKSALAILAIAVLLAPLMLRAALTTDPQDLSLPEGFRAQVLAKGFTYPTSLAVDGEGNIYIGESGYAYGPKTTEARIFVLNSRGHLEEVAGEWNEPINGLHIHEDTLYVSHRGTITALDLKDGEREDLLTDLPSWGDHQNNDLLIGADGALYIGQGTATNAGVVGSDNFLYGWMDTHEEFHDIPSGDFVLTGENYQDMDLRTPAPHDEETTGAFAPFGQEQEEGEVLEGEAISSGTILRLDLETKEVSMYAHGLRNPYGLALDEDGILYASNLGYDDRGVRAVANSPDWIVEVVEGAWYGWPDYAGTLPLSHRDFASARGVNRKPLLADPPPVEEPLLSLPPHTSPMKMDQGSEEFTLAGLFVAVFGDAQPLTGEGEDPLPTGILHIEGNEMNWFARNSDNVRAGRFDEGFKRLIDVKFGPQGRDMYVLDFGVMEFTDLTPNAIPDTGVLWRITSPGAEQRDIEAPLEPQARGFLQPRIEPPSLYREEEVPEEVAPGEDMEITPEEDPLEEEMETVPEEDPLEEELETVPEEEALEERIEEERREDLEEEGAEPPGEEEEETSQGGWEQESRG